MLVFLSYERVKKFDQMFVLHVLGSFTAHKYIIEHVVDNIMLKLLVHN